MGNHGKAFGPRSFGRRAAMKQPGMPDQHIATIAKETPHGSATFSHFLLEKRRQESL